MKRTALYTRGALAALAGFSLALTGCAGGADASGDGDSGLSGQVIWADYGGPTNQARQEVFFDSFADEYGVEVVSTSIEDAIFQSMLDGDPGDYDAFQVEMRDILVHPEGVLEVPDSARADLAPDELRPNLVGGFYVGFAQGWLAETFPDGGPQNWADFFDVEKFPGKRAWPGAPGSVDGSFEIALLADGVAPEDLYPLDIDRAVKKLDTIRDHLVFYQAYPEVQQLLSSESVAIAVTVTGQYTALEREGFDVTIQWNEAFQVLNGFVIPTTANNPDAALALAEWIRDPERQAQFVERTLYGPVNEDVFEHLPADIADKVVNAPSHGELIGWDEHWRAENDDAMINAYTAWLAG